MNKDSKIYVMTTLPSVRAQIHGRILSWNQIKSNDKRSEKTALPSIMQSLAANKHEFVGYFEFKADNSRSSHLVDAIQ